MSDEPKMFRINPENRESEPITEANFADLGLRERYDIQEWIAANPGILGDDLLVVGKEFSDFDRTSEQLDLLAVDADGKLVIIELKRDDTGADVHWQAIKYASYLSKASAGEIIRILADYAKISEDDAEQRIREHLDANDLGVINNDQRIIIASHRFAPEVTSAVLWLNEKGPDENLITCIQLTPYQDTQTNTLYLQTNTIIPVPGAEKYTVQIGGSRSDRGDGDSGPALQRRRSSNRAERENDVISRFCRRVDELAKEDLPDKLHLGENHRWARGTGNRWFCMWYSRYPWSAGNINYVLHLDQNNSENGFEVAVNFEIRKRYLREQLGYSETQIDALTDVLRKSQMHDQVELEDTRTYLRPKVALTAKSLDDEYAGKVVDVLRQFIEVGTPAFEHFEIQRNIAEANDPT